MQEYLDQVRQVATTNLYYLTLGAALVIPDMCAGLESANGESDGNRYKAWVNVNLAPRYTVGPDHDPSFTGEDCWGLRCSFLHQGHLHPHQGSYTRIIFTEPHSGPILHNNVINDALNIDVTVFTTDMISAAEAWLSTAQATSNFQRNYPNFMHRYENGLPPFIVGVPVIA